MDGFRDAFRFLRDRLGGREKATILASVAVAVISSLFLALSPLILAQLADTLVAASRGTEISLPWLATLCGAYLVFVSAQRLLVSLSLYFESLLRMATTKRLASIYFSFLVGKGQEYFLHRNAGSVAQYLNQINNELYTIVRSLVGEVISPLAQLAASLILLYFAGLEVVALMFVGYCVLFIVNHRIFTKKIVDRKLALMDAGRKSYETLIDSVSNISLARQFGTKSVLQNRYDAVLDKDRATQARYWGANFRMMSISAGLYVALFSASFIYAVTSVMSGSISVGQFVMVATYVLMLTSPIEQLGDMFAQLSQSLAAFGEFARSLNKDLDEARALKNKYAEGSVRVETDEIIRLTGVNFSYPEAKEASLRDFNLNVTKGQKLSITGPSGGGKSTVFKLLTKQYDAPAGTVSLFGRDILEIDAFEASAMIGYVAQDTLVFKDTLRFNLMIANPDATDDMLYRALDLARLSDIIPDLRHGLDTVLGDRGDTVSGGQKQRIAFARLFLRNPQLILLDEASSALDVSTEQKIFENLLREFDDRTIISISHRESAVRMLEDVVVVERGTVVTHSTVGTVTSSE
jgi:ATP-binding cassette subfamily B protein